ncbi:MAG: GNAT family N-acetyltransferase [Candidatus Thorarchaeota archaeon]
MPNKELNFTCKRISNAKYSEQILTILKSTLLTPNDYEALSPEEKNNYRKKGYVIGNQNLKTIEKWVSNKDNIIIIASIDLNGMEKVVGYLLTLQTKEIQLHVQDYLKDMVNLDINLTRNLDKSFSYLIQIAVDPTCINKGIGTKMFDELKKHLKRTVVSYVMKSPLLNEISLYTHLKAGFSHFGDYVGKYDEFKDYQSVGLMLPQSDIKIKSKPAKKVIIDRMKKASNLACK